MLSLEHISSQIKLDAIPNLSNTMFFKSHIATSANTYQTQPECISVYSKVDNLVNKNRSLPLQNFDMDPSLIFFNGLERAS